MDYIGNYKLDARPDRIDLRDREYNPPLRNLAACYPSEQEVAHFFPLYADHELVLDQGKEGACTGFGLAAMINYLIWRRDLEAAVRAGDQDGLARFRPPVKVSMRMLYHLARFYDEWPGEDYEGSSCRGAVKAWHRHGVCADGCWPYRDRNGRVTFIDPEPGWDTDAAKRPLGVYYRIQKDALADMQAAIQEVGAIYVSASVHRGWNAGSSSGGMSHANLPLIDWQTGAAKTGGHAFALVGYNEHGFIIQNSWGHDWGLKGFAILGYDDWLENGTDAWVCVMGVPKQLRVPSHYLPSAARRFSGDRAGWRATGGSETSVRQPDHDYQDAAVRPWDAGEAYRHTVVMGNDGRVINRLVTKSDAAHTVDFLAYHEPKRFFEGTGEGVPPRLVVYAHGGLNPEESSIGRIRIMAPYFKANTVYPLFFTWKTGVVESLAGIMEDAALRQFDRAEGLEDLFREARRKAEDVLDRTLEFTSANLGVKALWSQMKQNAAEASKKGAGDRGAFLVTQALGRLARDIPGLEIHFVGHSAGSLLLGAMLGDFPRNGLTVKTFTLLAPACSIDFANRTVLRAMQREVLTADALYLHILSDRREQEDTVGPYRKSLLYLVSRALEEQHKTPLLGLANALDPQKNDTGIWSPETLSSLRKWQKLGYWGSDNLFLLDSEYVVTARRWDGAGSSDISRSDSAHGSFDNDIEIIDQTLCRILDRKTLVHRVENLRY